MTFDRAYHRWSLTHAAVLTAGTVLVVGFRMVGQSAPAVQVGSVALPIMAIWSATALALLYTASRRLDSRGFDSGGQDYWGARGHWGEPGLWVPDALTAVRGIAAVVMLWALPGVGQWSAATVWMVGSILALVELTDFFDGRAARRFGPSAFGAVWDMENDALFTLSLSLLVYLRHGMAPFVLLLGLTRYLYVLVWRFEGIPGIVSPAYRLFAKITAAAIVVTLLVTVAPIVPTVVRSVALVGVLGMQLISFGWDLALQYRTRRLSGSRR